MAVTQAGCDLTYCKMRGIVSVLTGTSLNRFELFELFYLSYVYKRLFLFDYALEKKKKKDAICQKCN